MKRKELEKLKLELKSVLPLLGPLEGAVLNATDMNERISNKTVAAFDKIASAVADIDALLEKEEQFKNEYLEAVGECGYEEDAYTGDITADYKFAQYLLEQHCEDGTGTIYDREDNPNFDNEIRTLKKFLRKWKKFAGIYD